MTKANEMTKGRDSDFVMAMLLGGLKEYYGKGGRGGGGKGLIGEGGGEKGLLLLDLLIIPEDPDPGVHHPMCHNSFVQS